MSPMVRREYDTQELIEKSEATREVLTKLLLDAAQNLDGPRRAILTMAMADNLKQHREKEKRSVPVVEE